MDERSVDIVKDIFLTDYFMIKGLVETGGSRLSDYLTRLRRSYVRLHNVTLIDLLDGTSVSAPEAMIQKKEIILAHELLDIAGDATLRQMVDKRSFSLWVDLYHTGNVGMQIRGRIRPEIYEEIDIKREFFVVRDVTVRGINVTVNPQLKRLSSLPYAIINKQQINYIFSDPPAKE